MVAIAEQRQISLKGRINIHVQGEMIFIKVKGYSVVIIRISYCSWVEGTSCQYCSASEDCCY